MHLKTSSDIGDFAWSDNYLLGFGEMDATHREFVDVVAALQGAPDTDLLVALDHFIAHAQAHFGVEDQWMRDTAFPPSDCHIEEHAAVMKSADEVRERVVLGDYSVARSFAAELQRWFPGHADYLDSALAAWMVKRRLGGKPVVLKRNLDLK
jgi:hemerythrin